MMRNILKFLILISMLFGLPVSGVILSGQSIHKFLEFPPKTHYVQHSSFSWIAFIIISAIILIPLSAYIIILIRYIKDIKARPTKLAASGRMPRWGKLGLLSMIFFWIFAWIRLESIEEFQRHTFPFLWLSYIITVNSLSYYRTGKCLLTGHTGKFLLLLPISAVFWWYFEYINEFVRNWYYLGPDYSETKFLLLATVSFSTVLPAVASTGELLLSYLWINEGFKNLWSIKIPAPKLAAVIMLIISCSGLLGISVYTDYLFPLVWVSPVLILVSLQSLFNERHILSDIASGDWRRVASASLAALICGLFWETWNFYSFPKWHYSIPLVQRFHVFEMPLLGYAGYLPFGLMCFSISMMLNLNND